MENTWVLTCKMYPRGDSSSAQGIPYLIKRTQGVTQRVAHGVNQGMAHAQPRMFDVDLAHAQVQRQGISSSCAQLHSAGYDLQFRPSSAAGLATSSCKGQHKPAFG